MTLERTPYKVRDGVYISDGGAARMCGDEFEHVITLSRDDGLAVASERKDGASEPSSAEQRNGDVPSDGVGSHEHTTQHFPLYDGPQTSQDDFDRAVGAVIRAIDVLDGDVLVHCQAGVSRSATVLITALAEIDGTTWDEAHDEVWEAKPSISPHMDLRDMALEFLGQSGPYSRE